MPNPENIRNLTHEQLSENGRKGALKANENRKRRKAMKEELLMILSLPVKKSTKDAVNKMLSVDKAKALEDFKGRNSTVQTQILLKLSQMAMSGNLKAFELILDLSGERTQKAVDTSALERLDNILGGLNKAGFEDDD